MTIRTDFRIRLGGPCRLSTASVDFLLVFLHLRRCVKLLARRRFEVFRAEQYAAEVFATFVPPDQRLLHSETILRDTTVVAG